MEKKITLIGLPKSGKTTFLAAFYQYLIKEDVSHSLIQDKPTRDASYLNEILSIWLDCEEQSRTNSNSSNRDVLLHLRSLSGHRLDLRIPDMEGEVFNRHWHSRIWDKKYESIVNHSSGILFFLPSENFNNHILKSDVENEFFELLKDKIDTEIDPTQDYESSEEEWLKNNTPLQVIVVDILQTHIDKMSGKIPCVFVISAWDKVEENILPKDWMRNNLPLLDQFLTTNTEHINPLVLGVSAQGGDYVNESVADELRAKDNPLDKILVVHEASLEGNIAYPINWIIDQWSLE